MTETYGTSDGLVLLGSREHAGGENSADSDTKLV